MKIIVVRHGETAYNKSGRYMGHNQNGLNQLGKEQASKLAERLINEKINFIYSSDLNRARETAEHIKDKFADVALNFEPQLRERDIGIFEGKLKSEVDWNSLPGNELTRKPLQGESLTDMKGRVNRFLKHLKDRHVGENVLLVSHAGTIRIIHHILTRESLIESFEKFNIHNTAVSVYDLSEKKPRVLMFNDISHLN